MDENERPLLHFNTALQNLVLDRQRELETELVELLEQTKELRGFLDKHAESIRMTGGTGATAATIERNIVRVEEIEKTLQVYDRLAQRPWDRVKGWLSLAALVISVIALASRFVGHAG